MARWIVVVFGIVSLFLQVRSEDLITYEEPHDNSNYNNYTLIRLIPSNNDQLKAAAEFKDPDGNIEVLKSSRDYNDSLDVLVPPDKLNFIRTFADEKNLQFQVKQSNYGSLLESLDRVPRRRLIRSFSVFEYNSFTAIQEYIETLAQQHKNLVTIKNYGSSSQGRPINLVKISANPNAGNPIIFVDAGVHAREWVAPAMALYIMHRLTNDPQARQTDLNGVDWYIVPVVNPDGYEYTRSSKSNRLWRKTRSKHGKCYGVDGNRNYGFKWAVSGASSNPCDKETYAGPRPFSEPETQIIRNIMMENAKRMKLYVSLHAYGQYLVYPWGYTGDFLPRSWKKLDTMARAVSDAVQAAGGRPFRVLSAGRWYAAAGGSDDFAFGAVGVPYSYTMELTDGYEFVYPERLLQKVLPQFYEGFKVFGAQIRKEFRNSRESREHSDED